jgi:hypothetical protein
MLSHLHAPTVAPAITDQQHSIPTDATPAIECVKAAHAPPIALLDDEPEPTASEFVDSTYYGEVISTGLERPPRDVEEPRLWTLTHDTTRTLSNKKTQTAYDEYHHIDWYAFVAVSLRKPNCSHKSNMLCPLDAQLLGGGADGKR